MSGNTWGRFFKVTTFGESHGPAIGAIIDGCPPGVKITREDIQTDLDKRRPGQSDMTTSRSESDQVEILSGIMDDTTTGTPIGLLIRNKDAKSSSYDHLKELFRPGHADLSYFLKYGIREHRGGGRSSGRETASRVAAGAIARIILKDIGVKVYGSTIQIGHIIAKERDMKVRDENLVRCPDKKAAVEMEALVRECGENGDSVGGMVEIIAEGVPGGLGDPVFDKLDAEIAKAMMSIGAVKAVEIGKGQEVASTKGSEMSDPFVIGEDGKIRSKYNHCGGILGGISTGDPIYVRIAVKPTASISIEQDTVDISGEKQIVKVKGRHDPCICPRIVPVAESMMCILLLDNVLSQRGKTGEAGSIGKIFK
jgi:chorismate synthase